MKTHYTIPFFIPHAGCPFTCIFCQQKKISGRPGRALVGEVAKTIRRHLMTIPRKRTVREVAFFGGSFTGLSRSEQEAYLKAVRPFIRNGSIHRIRISTRPDLIDDQVLGLLKKYGVRSIELGVQSICDDVLKAAKRGHTAADVRRASRLIIKHGFVLGHQIMVGLPKSTPDKETRTVRAAAVLGAKQARVYPVLVVRGTELAALWKKGRYRPLGIDEAVARCAGVVDRLTKNGITVLRCGLHPSEGLLTGRDLLAGAFHESFGQMVATHRYGELFKAFLKKEKNPDAIRGILFNPVDAASVVGYKRKNAEFAEAFLGRKKLFRTSDSVDRGNVIVEYGDGHRKAL